MEKSIFVDEKIINKKILLSSSISTQTSQPCGSSRAKNIYFGLSKCFIAPIGSHFQWIVSACLPCTPGARLSQRPSDQHLIRHLELQPTIPSLQLTQPFSDPNISPNRDHVWLQNKTSLEIAFPPTASFCTTHSWSNFIS